MTKKAHIVVLKGDGIGPEVVDEALVVLKAIAAARNFNFTFEEQLIGGAAIDATGMCECTRLSAL